MIEGFCPSFQIYLGSCYGCGEKFTDKRVLVEHMHSLQHVDRFPEPSVWDQPQYVLCKQKYPPHCRASSHPEQLESEMIFAQNMVEEMNRQLS